MPIDPPIQRVFDLLAQHRGPASDAPAAPVPLADRRREADTTMLLASTGPQEGVTVSDHTVTVTGGEILVRVTRPAVFDSAPGPGLLFIHGGGWFQGNLDTAEVECGPMATLVPCVVVSVDYRLAPENPFPIPLEDCIAAWTWLHAHVADLGIDPARVAVAGTSAGGNLAAALCLAARDRGLPLPVLQLLDVPCLDMTLSSPSVFAQETQAGLTGEMADEFASFYVPNRADRTNPLVSPLLAHSHAGLPPAVIVVAEHDPLRDDGEHYLTALHAADVPASAVRVLAHAHGTWVIPGTTTFHLVRELRAGALRQAFTGGA